MDVPGRPGGPRVLRPRPLLTCTPMTPLWTVAGQAAVAGVELSTAHPRCPQILTTPWLIRRPTTTVESSTERRRPSAAGRGLWSRRGATNLPSQHGCPTAAAHRDQRSDPARRPAPAGRGRQCRGHGGAGPGRGPVRLGRRAVRAGRGGLADPLCARPRLSTRTAVILVARPGGPNRRGGRPRRCGSSTWSCCPRPRPGWWTGSPTTPRATRAGPGCVAVVGGSGGAGASVLATALAVTGPAPEPGHPAHRRRPARRRGRPGAGLGADAGPALAGARRRQRAGQPAGAGATRCRARAAWPCCPSTGPSCRGAGRRPWRPRSTPGGGAGTWSSSTCPGASTSRRCWP